MQKQKTIYHLIVDKSGSMSDCIEQTIGGFNEQIQKIQQLEKEYTEHEISIGLTTFNDEVFHHYFQSPPGAVRKLDTDQYKPNGTTALLDAIGMTIERIEKQIKEDKNSVNTTVVLVILTDGHENSSTKFKIKEIRNAISRLEETGKWTFSFLGATIDAVDVAMAMAIKPQNSYTFEKSNMQEDIFDKLSVSMETYMNKKSRGKDLGDFLSK